MIMFVFYNWWLSEVAETKGLPTQRENKHKAGIFNKRVITKS